MRQSNISGWPLYRIVSLNKTNYIKLYLSSILGIFNNCLKIPITNPGFIFVQEAFSGGGGGGVGWAYHWREFFASKMVRLTCEKGLCV